MVSTYRAGETAASRAEAIEKEETGSRRRFECYAARKGELGKETGETGEEFLFVEQHNL